MVTQRIKHFNPKDHIVNGDAFNIKMFLDVVNLLGDVDYVCMDAGPNLDISIIKDYKYTSKYVVLGIVDSWHGWDHDTFENGSDVFDYLEQEHPDKHFFFFSDYVEPYLVVNKKNITNLTWSGLTYRHEEYKQIKPVTEKNFLGKHVVCLNRLMRMHRIVLLSYLYAKKYNKHIHLTALKLPNKSNKSFMDQVDWNFTPDLFDIRDECIQGYDLLCKDIDNLTGIEPYKVLNNSEYVVEYCNTENFEKNLRKIYLNSVVEIITESTYILPTGFPTEKYLHTIYGFNFPIIVSNKGMVKYLRDFGFDMFDDIIDHSYDCIEDNLLRLQQAIELNKEIITNKEFAIEQWHKNKDRFEKNLEFAQNEMCEKFYNDAITIVKNEITPR